MANTKFLQYSYLIAGLYDIFLGIGVFFLFDLIVIDIFQAVKPDPYLFVQVGGLFVFGFGYLLIITHKKAEEFVIIGFASGIIRIMFSFIVLLEILQSNLNFFYYLLGLSDLITGGLLLFALYKSNLLSFDLFKFES